MSKLSTWKCKICREEVKEIGAYVKLALGQYAHLTCFETAVYKKAWDAGREDLIVTQEGERQRVERERKQRETQAAIDEHVRLQNYIQALPRCQECGRRINDVGIHRTHAQRDIAEVHTLNSQVVGRGDGERCKNCVEAERIARNDARSAKAPPPSMLCSTAGCDNKPAPSENKCTSCLAKDKPRDRFGVIELD